MKKYFLLAAFSLVGPVWGLVPTDYSIDEESDSLVIAPAPFELEMPSLAIDSDPKNDLAYFLRPPALQNVFTEKSKATSFESHRILDQVDLKIPMGVHLSFQPMLDKPAQSWSATVINSRGTVIKEFQGEGPPPSELSWDGQEGGWSRIQAGEPYNFVFDAKNRDGSSTHLVGTPVVFPYFFLHHDLSLVAHLATPEIFDKSTSAIAGKGRSVLLALCERVAQYPMNPVSIDLYATDLKKAQRQSGLLKDFIANTLMKNPDEIMTEIQIDPQETESIRVQILGVKK